MTIQPGGVALPRGLGGPLTVQMVPNSVDNERGPVPRALPVTLGCDRPGGDDVSPCEAVLLLPQVQFDVPLPAIFAEVDAVPVHVAFPLLGHLPAVAVPTTPG